VPGKRLWRTGAGRAGGSGRTSRPFKWGPRTPSGILSSTQTARRLRTVFYPPTDAPFLSLLHFPVALPTGEAGRSLGSARGARGWQPAIGSPTLTPRSGLGANLGRDVGFHGFSSQFCHGLHLAQVLSFSRSFVWFIESQIHHRCLQATHRRKALGRYINDCQPLAAKSGLKSGNIEKIINAV
jgi:hypothetical protein